MASSKQRGNYPGNCYFFAQGRAFVRRLSCGEVVSRLARRWYGGGGAKILGEPGGRQEQTRANKSNKGDIAEKEPGSNGPFRPTIEEELL